MECVWGQCVGVGLVSGGVGGVDVCGGLGWGGWVWVGLVGVGGVDVCGGLEGGGVG